MDNWNLEQIQKKLNSKKKSMDYHKKQNLEIVEFNDFGIGKKKINKYSGGYFNFANYVYSDFLIDKEYVQKIPDNFENKFTENRSQKIFSHSPTISSKKNSFNKFKKNESKTIKIQGRMFKANISLYPMILKDKEKTKVFIYKSKSSQRKTENVFHDKQAYLEAIPDNLVNLPLDSIVGNDFKIDDNLRFLQKTSLEKLRAGKAQIVLYSYNRREYNLFFASLI